MTRSTTSQLIVSLLDRVTGPARTVGNSLRGMNRTIRDGQGVTTRFADRVDSGIMRATASLDSARMGILDAVGGYYLLRDAIAAPVRDAMAFEEAMADVRKVVDFPTPESLRLFQRELMALSKEVPVTVDGLAAIAAAAGQAGIAGDELVKFTEAAAKIGVAFDITADQAGDSLAKMMTGLGITLDEAISLSDAMNHLSNAQASSAADILDVLRRVGAQAKMFGFSAEQAAAFGSAMVASGAQSDVAATSFLNMGRALTRGASATNRQSGAFAKLGLDAEEVARRMQDDAAGTTVDVMQRLAALPAEMRAAVATDLFGDEARALGPLLTNLDLVRESLGMVGSEAAYAGSAFKEFETRNQTFGARMQRFRNVMQALRITVGNALIPVLSDLMERITPVVEAVGRFVEANPELAANVLTGVAALVALRGAFSLLRFVGLLPVLGGLKALSGAMTALKWAGALEGIGGFGRAAGDAAKAVDGIGASADAAAARTRIAARDMQEAIRGVRLRALTASALGALALLRVPEFSSEEELQEWQKGNRETMEGWLRWLPGTKQLMDVGDWLNGVEAPQMPPPEQTIGVWRDGIAAQMPGVVDMINGHLAAVRLPAFKSPVFDPRSPVRPALGDDVAAREAAMMGSYSGGRARGGPISAGRTYLVGEEGPELVTPSRSGHVHPSGAGGGVTVNLGGITVNAPPGLSPSQVAEEVLQAIDARIGSTMRRVFADSM